MNLKKFVKFKHKNQLETVVMMHPLIISVMFDMAFYCSTRNIPFVVTDTISTIKKDSKLGRISDSHRTMRAFDLRSKTFLPKQRIEFVSFFNEKYKDIASVSLSDNKPRLIVLHGTGENIHFHISIHSKFKIKGF
jgi:hypothetical protein